MREPDKPIVTVVHSVPGRLRVRLSRAPSDQEQLVTYLRDHPGMGEIRFTRATRSLLVHFDPHTITTEEISLRVAFGFGLDQGGRPVRLLSTPDHVTLQDSAVFSGIGLLTALATRWLNPGQKQPNRFEWFAGASTALSIAGHGWKELRERGYFDPEVLALVYLAAALVRGNVLSAAAVTWLTTFGRHLIEIPSNGVEVQPNEVRTNNSDGSRYELVVGPDVDAPHRLRSGVLNSLQAVLKYGMSGGGAHGIRSLWEEIRDVSRIHGEVLEGFGQTRHGIPIRFR